jgi:hypothetical protein
LECRRTSHYARLFKEVQSKVSGAVFPFYVAWYGLGGIRSDSLFIYGTDIRVSQLLAAISLSVAVVILVRNHLRGYTSNSKSVTKEIIDENGGTENAEL